MRAFIFPGQGSQFIGMGTELAQNFLSARHIFQEIDDVLSFKLYNLMANGREEDLQLTTNTQPALFAVSAAVLAVLKVEFNFQMKDHIHFLAGHSLGEYCAYYAGGSLSLKDTALILRKRGQVMQESVPQGLGGMIALIGADMNQVEQLIADQSHDHGVCEIANDNAPGQIIVSGHLQALTQLKSAAIDIGIRRIIPLPVSAPFHCSLMQNAADLMQDFLKHFNFQNSSIPLFNNITAQTTTKQEDINPLLVQQITGRVRWRETIQNMAQQSVDEIIEVGAGKVLCGLTKRICPDIRTGHLESIESIETWMTTLNRN